MSYNTELQNNNQELRGILEDVNELPEYPEVPTKISELENDSGFIKSNEAPVQSVNGKAGVVTLAAGDVGARPSTWTPTYSDVGADKSGTASSAVSSHNTNTDAHNDIRLLIAGLTEKLNALANSTDDDLDQMAEIVAYIKSNKTLIDSITTSKVSVADVVNNLTSNVANKPLSAAQGVVLKALIDAITVPTKVSQLTNDKGYLTSYTETDPTVPSWAKQSSKPRYNANEVGAVAYTAQSLTEEQKAQARANIAALGKSDISLGIASDGLIYIFVNGVPVGTGIPQGQSGDVFGYVDENNTIVLNGNLADGNYTVKYEMEDGSTVDIGNLELGEEPEEIVNQIPLSTDTDGTVYNGIGYKTNTRINSSGLAVAMTGYSCTGFIPAKTGDKLYMSGMYVNDNSGNTKIALYKTDKTLVRANIFPTTGGYVSEGNDIYSHTIEDANVAFVRLSVNKTMDGSEIVTVNQPIV